MYSLIYDDINILCSTYGCANQPAIESIAMERLRPYVDELFTDNLGNVIGIRRADDPTAKTILLEAHMDEVGMLVTHIDDAGFIHVAPAGGIDARIMAAQPVIVFGDKPFDGVVCSVPPHLAKEDKTLPTIEALGIDIGMSVQEVRRCVPLGSRVTFASNFKRLNDTHVCSKSLDNRSGMASILHCLRLLSTRAATVVVAFCVQEELGCRGASVVARRIQPDAAIVTDVSFAMAHGEDSVQCGILGNGVMIGVSPVLDDLMTRRMFTLADMYAIACQTEVMAATTGTDADQISIAGCGIPCALLSVPLRYMHTPNEIVDIRDVASVGELMARFIEGGELK